MMSNRNDSIRRALNLDEDIKIFVSFNARKCHFELIKITFDCLLEV